MPRSPDGSYTLPSGTLVNTGDTLLVSQHNPALQDMASVLGDSLDRDGLGGMRADLAMGGYKVTGLAPGESSTDAATVGQLSGTSGTPVGAIIDFAGASVPDGWLVCAGQSLSRTDYAALFAVIGTNYGSASGSTFNLPDCRGRVSAGRDLDQGGLANRLTSVTPNGTTVGAVGGAQSVALTIGQLAAHTHTGSTGSAGAHSHTVNTLTIGDQENIGSGASGINYTDFQTTSSAGSHTHTMSLDNTGSGEAHPNVQPTILFNKLIKAV